MKFLFALLVLSPLAYPNIQFNEECSLEKTLRPFCYHKRKSPIVNVALIHYGSSIDLNHLQKISDLLKVRFGMATQNKLEVEILHSTIIPLQKELPEDYSLNDITDKKRLHRLWYYENIGGNVLKEAYEEYKNRYSHILRKLDSLLVITEAQFNGLGLAYGRVSATEYPMEIAWALSNQGRTEYPTDYKIVDELIHEIGHNLFLGHAATQCQDPKLTNEEKLKCIEDSPNSQDVMSYSRNRKAVDQNHMHSFEQCNLNMIEKSIVPNLLKGGVWNFRKKVRCR